MITVLTIVLAVLLAITSSLLVVLILLHRGKGGDCPTSLVAA